VLKLRHCLAVGSVSHDARFVFLSFLIDPHSPYEEISDRSERACENHEPGEHHLDPSSTGIG